MNETIGPSLAFYLEHAVEMDALAASMNPEGVSLNDWLRVRKVITKAQAQAKQLLTGPASTGLRRAATQAGLVAREDSGDISIERHWAYWMAFATDKDADAQISLGVAIDWQPYSKPWLGVALDFYRRRSSSRKHAVRILQKNHLTFQDTTGWAGWRGQILLSNRTLDASTLLSDCEDWVTMTVYSFLTKFWLELTR
jgi:hypothetical protein